MAEEDVLNVVFSMDCLPAGGKEEVSGPQRWDEAERSPVAFAEALDQLGFTGTFFFAPESLSRVSGTAEDLRSAGFELGLLCHPQLSGYQACLGAYSYERQREIVGVSRLTWEDHLGERPETFRSGFFSANDYTFHVLCMEGYRQGSCSLPGRTDHDQCSIWFQTYPFPHHTDPLDRTAAGSMEFFEVPVTSDFEAAAYVDYETYTPPHLRIEEADVHTYARELVTRQLVRMTEEGLPVRVVHLVTSNLVPWGKEEDPHTERLQNLCNMLREVAERRGLEVRSDSLQQLHQRADEAFGVDLELDAETE